MPKNKRRIPPIIRHRQKDDQDDDDTSRRPKDTHFVDQVQILGEEDVDDRTDEHHRPEHQNGLPRIGDIVLIPQRNRAEDQLSGREGDTERDGPVSHERQPSVNEGHHRGPLLGRQHGAPVVHAAGGRVDGADFGQRGGDRDRDQSDENPAPDDSDRLTVCQGDVHGRAETEGSGNDGEGTVWTSEYQPLQMEIKACRTTHSPRILIMLRLRGNSLL